MITFLSSDFSFTAYFIWGETFSDGVFAVTAFTSDSLSVDAGVWYLCDISLEIFLTSNSDLGIGCNIYSPFYSSYIGNLPALDEGLTGVAILSCPSSFID